jgi:hypothetical protein
LQLDTDATPDYVVLYGVVIEIGDQRHWLYAAANTETNPSSSPSFGRFEREYMTIVLALREFRQKQHIDRMSFLVGHAHNLTTARDGSASDPERFTMECGTRSKYNSSFIKSK